MAKKASHKNKNKKLEEVPFETVTLDNGTKLKKLVFYYTPIYDNPASELIRHYLIDFSSLFSEKVSDFMDEIKKELKCNDAQLAHYYIQLRLYLYLTSPVYGQKQQKNQLSRKRKREFNLLNLYYSDTFEILRRTAKTEGAEKKTSEAERIKLLIIKDYLKTADISDETAYKTAFANAIYENTPNENIFLPIYWKKIAEMFGVVAKYERLMIFQNMALNEQLKKQIDRELLGPPAISYIRHEGLEVILSKIKDLINEIEDKIIEENSEGTLRDFLSRNTSYFESTAADLYKELLEYLEDSANNLESKVRFPSAKENQEWLKRKIKEIESIVSNDSAADKFLKLVVIYTEFSDQGDFYQWVIMDLEKTVRFLISAYSKSVFRRLEKQENLSKPEKRLFIMHNIGVPSLYRRTPILEPVLLRFFSFEKVLAKIFIESVLKKNSKTEEHDLGLYLKIMFNIFLNFYSFWHETVKDEEKTKKADWKYEIRKVPYEENLTYTGSGSGMPSENAASDEENKELDESFGYEDKANEEETSSELHSSSGKESAGRGDKPENDTKKGPNDPETITVRPKGDRIDTIKLRDKAKPEKAFEIFDYVKEALSESEYKLFIEFVINGITPKEKSAEENPEKSAEENPEKSAEENPEKSAEKKDPTIEAIKKKLRKHPKLKELKSIK